MKNKPSNKPVWKQVASKVDFADGGHKSLRNVSWLSTTYTALRISQKMEVLVSNFVLIWLVSIPKYNIFFFFASSHKSYKYQLRKLCYKLHQFSDVMYVTTYKSRHFSEAWSLLRKNEDEVTKFILAYFAAIVAGGEVVCAENERASQLPQHPLPPAFRRALQ
jgi:hypothetical protein